MAESHVDGWMDGWMELKCGTAGTESRLLKLYMRVDSGKVSQGRVSGG